MPVLQADCRDQLAGGDLRDPFHRRRQHRSFGTGDRAAARLDPAVKLVRFSRNFGKEAALAAGFRHASGDAVMPMDVDLQDPPEVVPRMVENGCEGAEIVNAIRRRRDTDTAFKRLDGPDVLLVYTTDWPTCRSRPMSATSDCSTVRSSTRSTSSRKARASPRRSTPGSATATSTSSTTAPSAAGGDVQMAASAAVPLRSRRADRLDHGAAAHLELSGPADRLLPPWSTRQSSSSRR